MASFLKETTVSVKHYGVYPGKWSGYELSWTMSGAKCSCEISNGTRGTTDGFIVVGDSGISFSKEDPSKATQ